uniref:Uncharacterized protein n=1 Tax=Arundo donax TaxID=35708 RepID=A0A0A9DQN3_ARUDO
MEYYSAGGTEGANANYYMQASEPHVLQVQQHSYYAPASASGIPVPVDGTSIAPQSYYTYPAVTMTVASSGVAPEHSGYYASSVSAISSSAVDTKTSSTSLVSANSNSDPTGPDKVIAKDASVAPLSQAVVATSAAGTSSMLGSSTQVSTSTTNQTKVIRTKKRAVSVTSSLRSNKKVSSLVDKVALCYIPPNAVSTHGCKSIYVPNLTTLLLSHV